MSRVLAVALAVKPHVGGLKVGLEFITANGAPVFADPRRPAARDDAG
ncbi:MAG TPA: hypothetical protein VGC36_17615 [Rhizomicrobium sp.]